MDYEKWATKEINSIERNDILKWNANYLNSVSIPLNNLKSIFEVGGAEGIVINSLTDKPKITVYELTDTFTKIGKKLYPKTEFIVGDFLKENDKQYDLVVLSDIVEHVDDNALLKKCNRMSRYALIKLPIENCFWNWFLKISGKLPKYGENHPSGHLRGYSLNGGLDLINQHFEIREWVFSNYYAEKGILNASFSQKIYLKLLKLFYPSTILTASIFGGSLFVFGERRISE